MHISGSGGGPDLRMGPKVIQMSPDLDSRVRIQEFLFGPQIRIGSSWASNNLYV